MKNSSPRSLQVLLVDDESMVLQSTCLALRTSGIAAVQTLQDSRDVMPLMATTEVGVLILDLTMPHVSGESLLQQVAADFPDTAVIVMTANNDVDTAVRCMQSGAIDYLLKPIETSRLVSAVRRGLEARGLRQEVVNLKDSLLSESTSQHEAFADIITQSKSMQAVFKYVQAIATSPQPVLISGETGTGKELIAQALHRLSGRTGDLITINVAGVDEAVFSDTLFGHTRGSYTGAERPREGLVSTAAEGTLLLDEIGDLSTPLQVKLLRLLQDGSYYPVGSDRPQRSLARILVSTNRDVLRDVAAGTFRRDLYYRLRAHHLELPPLRKREGDIALLARHFVGKAATTLNRSAPRITTSLVQFLSGNPWPGNVRDLEGLCFDAVARHEPGAQFAQSVKESMGLATTPSEPTRPDKTHVNWLPDPLPTLDDAEEALIDEALRRVGGNVTVAAGILGITRQALSKRLSRRPGTEDGVPSDS